MKTKKTLFAPYGLLGFVCMFCILLATCFVGAVIGCIYWMLMASLVTVSAIQSSWKRLLNSGYGWSKRQKTLFPRSDYGWRFEV